MGNIEIEPLPGASCTLDESDRAARLAEFDLLLDSARGGLERPAPTRLRVELKPAPAVAAEAARLAMAETACCSFFTFVLEVSSDRLVLDVSVPASHDAALATVAGRWAARLRSTPAAPA